MKQVFCIFLALELIVSLLAHPALAQTTNGINTAAERQAVNDAYTRNQAQRAAQATPSSPGANTPSSSISGMGRRQTLTEKEAEMNALFGFETAEQKAAAGRAVMQRYRDLDAADRAAEQRERDERKAAAVARSKAYAEAQDRRIDSMLPWDKVGYNISDCAELGSLSTRYQPSAEVLQLLDQARTARQDFIALYAQPTASYEKLRTLARQLPLREGKDYLYGINTAIKQYDQLFERFPAQRATAAADLAQAVVTYFGWFRAFDQDFEGDGRRLEKVGYLQKAAAANPAVGYVAGLRLAFNLKYKYNIRVISKSDGKGTGGVVKSQPENKFLDSALVGQLGRFAYAGCRHYERNGQAATLGLTLEQVRTETAGQMYGLAELQLLQSRPLAARVWLRRGLETDPTSEGLRQGTVNYYRTMLYEYPELFGELQPAEWALLQKPMGLGEPLHVKAVQAWLADTVRVPDDPRWQTLTEADRADLRQACAVAEWLTRGNLLLHYKSNLNHKRATWHFVLATGPGPDLDAADKLWRAMADMGDVAATRNLYRAYLLGDKLPARPEKELMYVANALGSNDENYTNGQKKYEAALLLLDELPNYPPLGKKFKKAGREKMQDAADSGSEGAKERLKRGF